MVPATGIDLAGSGTARTLRLKPAADASGTTLITVSVVDADGARSSAVFPLSVQSVNDAPLAMGQSVTLDEDTEVAIRLAGLDPEREALTYHVVTPPRFGVLSGTPRI